MMPCKIFALNYFFLSNINFVDISTFSEKNVKNVANLTIFLFPAIIYSNYCWSVILVWENLASCYDLL